MKAMKYSIPIILLIALSLSTGCLSKRYFFNFTTESDFARSDGIWSTEDSDYSFSDKGLLISKCWASAPHFYDGDFTVTWEFLLDVEGGATETLEFFLSSMGGYLGADWYGGIAFWTMGTVSSTYVTYYNPGDGIVYPDTGLSYDGILDETGPNEVQIIKTGDWLTFKINGTKMGSGFEIVGYGFDLFCPSIWCSQDMSNSSILIKSVEVEYSGEQFLRL